MSCKEDGRGEQPGKEKEPLQKDIIAHIVYDTPIDVVDGQGAQQIVGVPGGDRVSSDDEPGQRDSTLLAKFTNEDDTQHAKADDNTDPDGRDRDGKA